ncbi:peptidoglycan-binding domain-containing protein [Luteimonas aquatica]|uniref:peptidoglycan-binding domain-containing protein n=1 Tax=Luteimonas aquatica TaxID=450364 RepID=UPI001F5A5184|nr:peptidoglycan-binding protein [Luteimonas aquatica]
MPNDRITVIEPYGNVSSNRTVPHGMTGAQAYDLLKIHHPNSNARAERTQDPDLMERNSKGVPRTGRVVEGAMEEVSFVGDKDGIPLVKKDLILQTDRGSRNMMVPSPVEGYVQFTGDSSNTINIWSGPPTDRNRELVGRVLHGAKGSSPFTEGQFVPYGAPLVTQSNTGTKAVHAHVEVEPDQFRRYLGDVLNDRITRSQWPGQNGRQQPEGAQQPGGSQTQPGGQSQPARAPADPMADGMLKKGEEGKSIEELQKTLNQLGFRDARNQPLETDGKYGQHTKEAVEAYQRAHPGLAVDGIAGKDTLGSINRTLLEGKTTASTEVEGVNKPAQNGGSAGIDNPLYRQAVEQLEKQGPNGGFKNRDEMQRAAGQVAFEATVRGMSRIDEVVASTDGKGIIAVERNPNNALDVNRTYVDRQQAAAVPLEQSQQQISAEMQRQTQEAQTRQQPQPTQSAPTPGGP